MDDDAIVMIRASPSAYALYEYALTTFPDCVVELDARVVVVQARTPEEAARVEAGLWSQGWALGLELELVDLPRIEWVDSNSLRWHVRAKFADGDAATSAAERLSRDELAVRGLTGVSLYAADEAEAARLVERARLEPGFVSVRVGPLSRLRRWHLRVSLGAHYGHNNGPA